jgi:hypothetical protein
MAMGQDGTWFQIDGTHHWQRFDRAVAFCQKPIPADAPDSGGMKPIAQDSQFCPACLEAYRNKRPEINDITLLARVQEMDVRDTIYGPTQYIRIQRDDSQPMSWREVWEVFADRYPGKWAFEMFPPREFLVDDANIYHLYVLEEAPQGVDISWAEQEGP